MGRCGSIGSLAGWLAVCGTHVAYGVCGRCGMKAYMSNRGGRGYLHTAEQHERARAHSVYEARRILAETERDGVHHDILPGLLAHDLQPMRDLAEALAAFVADEDGQ